MIFLWILRTILCHCIHFRWQLEATNSCFWLVNIMLQKFDQIWNFIKKRNGNDNNPNVMMKNKKKPKKYMKVLSNNFLWTPSTDPWFNMLQTLQRWGKYIGIIFSDKQTRCYLSPRLVYHLANSLFWLGRFQRSLCNVFSRTETRSVKEKQIDRRE